MNIKREPLEKFKNKLLDNGQKYYHTLHKLFNFISAFTTAMTIEEEPYKGPTDPRVRGLNHRYLVLLAGFTLHLCIGQVYGFSVFTTPLRETHGSDWSNAGFIAYALGLGGLGYSAMAAGFIQQAIGPRKTALLSGGLFLVGHLGCALFNHFNNLFLFFVSYAIAGISFGQGYVAPVPAILKWFPDMKGLAGGFAVSGFGLGPILSGLVNIPLIENYGITVTFIVMAIYGSVLIVIAAMFLKHPPPGYLPPSMAKLSADEQSKHSDDGPAVNAKTALSSFLYWRVWLTQFTACFAGVSLISTIVPILEEVFELTSHEAGQWLVLTSIFNMGGRFVFPALSDYSFKKGLSRKFSFAFYLGTQAVIAALISWVMPNQWTITFVLLACYIYAAMGGSFGTLPALVSDTFGQKYSSSIFGFTLSAWATSGLLGPILVSFMRDRAAENVTDGDYSGIYVPFFIVLVIVLAIGFINSLTIRKFPFAIAQTKNEEDEPELEVTILPTHEAENEEETEVLNQSDQDRSVNEELTEEVKDDEGEQDEQSTESLPETPNDQEIVNSQPEDLSDGSDSS
ncbi:hypothetical protein P9112_012182 [Eukaryota sp. TZLM1-RC]